MYNTLYRYSNSELQMTDKKKLTTPIQFDTTIWKMGDRYVIPIERDIADNFELTKAKVNVKITPKQALRVSQAYLRAKGGRISSDYSGIQSLCADAVVAVKERGVPNMTLGCSGSRKYAKVADEEVVIGIPPKNFVDIVDALKTFKGKWGEL